MSIQNILGKIQISDDVISKIVGKIANTTSEISSMSTGLVEGITKKWSGKSLQNGIAIRKVETRLEINLKVVVRYGTKVHEVCRELQNNVRVHVEQLTGLTIDTVNVIVEGISMNQPDARF
ncbi:Asp23/Gls24 family envelope stress response protein [Paenibacillus sp. PCH8]|uniref:Asp23/Gls24 family envelope stress response protein n=1 Tax=Paenibacillus sp. PCH8 TaxID=2066524 RepID=UPI000CF8BBDA|nr:Asp23/Gls24 family envelope stress response protein [Paenibacillus sp. PCH8]PQP81301.1 Asp23/Gls24 family envelope stress response protein [Paenibacillus sp. PCH8]